MILICQVLLIWSMVKRSFLVQGEWRKRISLQKRIILFKEKNMQCQRNPSKNNNEIVNMMIFMCFVVQRWLLLISRLVFLVTSRQIIFCWHQHISVAYKSKIFPFCCMMKFSNHIKNHIIVKYKSFTGDLHGLDVLLLACTKWVLKLNNNGKQFSHLFRSQRDYGEYASALKPSAPVLGNNFTTETGWGFSAESGRRWLNPSLCKTFVWSPAPVSFFLCHICIALDL